LGFKSTLILFHEIDQEQCGYKQRAPPSATNEYQCDRNGIRMAKNLTGMSGQFRTATSPIHLTNANRSSMPEILAAD